MFFISCDNFKTLFFIQIYHYISIFQLPCCCVLGSKCFERSSYFMSVISTITPKPIPKVQMRLLLLNFLIFLNLFFSIWVFFQEHSRFPGQQGKKVAISSSPLYHFHSLHRHLDIRLAITAESSPLHIGSSRTRTGNLWFSSASSYFQCCRYFRGPWVSFVAKDEFSVRVTKITSRIGVS